MTDKRRLGPTQTKNRARWVLELLDTTDGQAKGTLCARDPDKGIVVGYCCLGIAQKMLAPASPRLRGGTKDHLNTEGLSDSAEGLMSDRTALRVFGMIDTDQEAAANWNDDFDMDFVQIARMVAWITSQGYANFEDVLPHDDFGDRGSWDDVVIPEDFDARAWAQGVVDG